MRYLRSFAPFLVVLAACHAGSDGAPPATATTAAKSAPAKDIRRGPVSLPFDPTGDGDPCSLAWDDATATLFVADNQHDQIWRWDDEAGFAKLTKLPSDPGAPDGRVESITSTLELTKPQGVAYDKTNHRVFVAVSNAHDVRTIKILPLDP